MYTYSRRRRLLPPLSYEDIYIYVHVYRYVYTYLRSDYIIKRNKTCRGNQNEKEQ